MLALKSHAALPLICLLIFSLAASPVDLLLGREYHGQYVVQQAGKTFDYLEQRSGEMIAIFYGAPNREVLNSVQLLLLDPKYKDGKAVLVDIKGIVEVPSGSDKWVNSSHSITYSRMWREREDELQQISNVSTVISFTNLPNDDYEQVTISIQMTGNTFEFSAQLNYFNLVLSTMAYSLYVSGVVGIQIYSAYRLLLVMDAPNFAFTAKFSLLTVSICNIEDFSQTMSHIQRIMSSEGGYLFFVLPSLAYIILFIIFDMKMLFLVWRSQNIGNLDNPQLIRKKLTAFYIQFYLGLFLYLTLNYFFADQEWMILICTLLLIPQLIHNVRLGQKPNFAPFYLFGFIGTRLFLPLYERSCPQNRFKLTPNIELVIVIFVAYSIQVVLIALQHRLGSRFFVPKRFLPKFYEYRMRIKPDEETREMECAICLQCLFESAPAAGVTLNESIREEMMAQVTIMNTPCSHKFHQQCLTQWMEVKLQCPTCRASLPAL